MIRRRRTGETPAHSRHGHIGQRLIACHGAIRHRISTQPDATLEEPVSQGGVWNVLDRLGQTLKKRRNTPPGRSGPLFPVLLWDGTGLELVAKRLEKSSFRLWRMSDDVARLTSSQLSALLDGLDWTRVRAARVPAPQATLEATRRNDSDATRATRAW
jgi:hypothetical protein